MMGNSIYLGRTYPFILDNSCLKEQVNRVEGFNRVPCYYYQFYSPGMSENQTPYISLTKISEDVAGSSTIPYGSDLDLLKMCTGDKKLMSRKATDFINESLFKREKFKPTAIEPKDNFKFPYFEADEEKETQKSLVISLRDMLRWRFYKFQPGNYIDVLWDSSKEEILICEVCEDENKVWLEPRGIYHVLDMRFENNLMSTDERMKRSNNKLRYWKKDTNVKVSDLNKYIKYLEYNSFETTIYTLPWKTHKDEE